MSELVKVFDTRIPGDQLDLGGDEYVVTDEAILEAIVVQLME